LGGVGQKKKKKKKNLRGPSGGGWTCTASWGAKGQITNAIRKETPICWVESREKDWRKWRGQKGNKKGGLSLHVT